MEGETCLQMACLGQSLTESSPLINVLKIIHFSSFAIYLKYLIYTHSSFVRYILLPTFLEGEPEA